MPSISIFQLALVFLSSLSLALTSEVDRDADILVWPSSSTKPQSYAHIKWNSTVAQVTKYSPPTFSSTNEIVRIGFYHSTSPKTWSGVITSSGNLAASKEKRIQLLLNTEGDLYHVNFRAVDPIAGGDAASKKDTSSAEAGLKAEVVPMKAGPTIHLNKPVVMNEDGVDENAVPEKTFLQKYWWAIAGFFLLQILISGPKE